MASRSQPRGRQPQRRDTPVRPGRARRQKAAASLAEAEAEEAEKENTGAPGEFRIRADKLFLTYPKCDLEKEEVLRQLKTIFPDYVGSVICREKHADGSLHIHCFVTLSQKVDIRDPSVADLTQPGGPTFHGNYQAVRSPKAVALYVIECGDYIVDNVDIATLPGCVPFRSRWGRSPVFLIEPGGERGGWVDNPAEDRIRIESIRTTGFYTLPALD